MVLRHLCRQGTAAKPIPNCHNSLRQNAVQLALERTVAIDAVRDAGSIEQAAFTIAEMTTGIYLSMRIDEKTTDGVVTAMERLQKEYGSQFLQVFRTITTDNDNEFVAFTAFEQYGTEVYYAHPYSSWERPVNERSNRLLRRFIPKGKSIHSYTSEYILMFSDELSSMPRKCLDYRTPEELFEA